MGTALTGLEIKDTYDGLVKTTDNGPISGTLKKLTDGLGNDSSLSLSTTAVSLSGSLAVSSAVSIDNELVLTSNNAAFRLYRTTGINYFDWSSGQDLAFSSVTSAGGSGRAEAMRITSAGNVGIGTSAPAYKLVVSPSDNDGVLISSSNDAHTGYLYFGDVSSNTVGAINYDHFSDVMRFNTGAVERFRITANGVTFNGDTAAANALSDYEQGTWTPSVAFGGASVGVVLSGANGATYTKIGRQVTVNGFFALTSKGSSTGAVTITGLPFTIANGSQFYATASLFIENISFANQFQGRGNLNTTTIQLFEVTEAGVNTTITNADFANNSNINLSLTYFV